MVMLPEKRQHRLADTWISWNMTLLYDVALCDVVLFSLRLCKGGCWELEEGGEGTENNHGRSSWCPSTPKAPPEEEETS